MLALKLRIMPSPFYQPWVSKGGSFEEGGVNQYGIVNGFYLSQNMSLVYFDLCVHGSLPRGTGGEFVEFFLPSLYSLLDPP